MNSIRIMFGLLSSVLFLFAGIGWFAGDSTIYADVTCSSDHCDSISPSQGSEVWESAEPAEPTADVFGEFETTSDLEFSWCWESVTLASSSWAWFESSSAEIEEHNIGEVNFTPQNWLMTNFGGCDGSKTVEISGTLRIVTEPGLVAYVGYGFAETGTWDVYSDNLIVHEN